MNIMKFYRRVDDTIHTARVRVHQVHSYYSNSNRPCPARAENEMTRNGWTGRRPREFRPHWHPAQQRVYRQPSEQTKRRARQAARQTAERRGRFSADI